jgi:diguanylate cyclase (GGDEF)-like protein/PAS domain S-box-containing protein
MPINLPHLLQTCLDHLNDSILITEAEPFDPPGPRIIWANKSFYESNGYTPEEVIGRTPQILQGPETDRNTLDRLRASVEKWESIKVELLNYRKDGTNFWNEFEIVPVADDSGCYTHWVSVQRDVSERKKLEKQLFQLAFYDSLTGLPNRRLFNDRLTQAIALSKRGMRYGALMCLDLDYFKELNDTHGHNVGDLLLIELSRRLGGCVREVDTVARFGGDEFVVIAGELSLEKEEAEAKALVIAQKILGSLSEIYNLVTTDASGNPVTIEHHGSCTIGVAMFRSGEASQDSILKWADAAMYKAKKVVRGSVLLHQP